MLRHIAEPLDAGGFHGGVGVQAFGDRVTDDRLTLFLQQLNQTTLLRHQTVDLRRFYIEERRDRLLLVERRNKRWEFFESCVWFTPSSCRRKSGFRFS